MNIEEHQGEAKSSSTAAMMSVSSIVDNSSYSLHVCKLFLADEVRPGTSAGMCELQRLAYCQDRQVVVVLHGGCTANT